MANPKKLSIIWEDKQISLLVVEKNQPVAHQRVDLSSIAQDAPSSIGVTTDIQTVALLQKTLRELKVDVADVYIGISNRDLILRSFVIPFLKPAEVQTAIQFEAKKYIPFDISELKYIYHTVPITENKVKRMRVFFYAIRREILEKYEHLVKQTGLNIISCEPMIVGLCRAMIHQKEITLDAKAAVLDLDHTGGRISFIDHGVVFFIRDFQLNPGLSLASSGVDSNSEELIKSRIFNEIRNSFEFFSRQFHDQITQLLVHADVDLTSVVEDFATELNVTIKKYQANIVSPAKSFKGLDVLSGFGLTLASPSSVVAHQDLLVKPKKPQSASMTAFNGLNIDFKELKPVIQFALAMVAVCVGVYIYLFTQTNDLKKQVNALASQQGKFDAQTKDDIEGLITKVSTDTSEINKIRFKSDLHAVILLISKYVSENMWLNNLDIRFNDPASDQVSIEFKGNVYVEDVNKQIRAMNDFVTKLRADKYLAKYFSKIELMSIQREQGNGVTYTSFLVKCN